MADRMIHISWGASIAGREERGLEVFNEALGLYGRMQQEGRIDSFDVALLVPNGGSAEGFINLNGSAAQLAAVREDEGYQRTMVDASLVVHDLCICDGFTNEGIAQQMTMYQEAIGRVPQMA
jgi:hypothetical protein